MSKLDFMSSVGRCAQRERGSVGTRFLGLIFALGAVLALGGCGSDGADEGPCADKDCAYGVCDSETGQCVNPEACGPAAAGDAGNMTAVDAGSDEAMTEESTGGECLRGYTCQQGECVAEYECGEERQCVRGVCERGACVDAKTCQGPFDCLPGKGCSEEGTCANLCEPDSCSSGVCNPETGECLNPQTCDPAADSGEDACLEDYQCADPDEDETFRCLNEQEYCQALGCERGVCSFERQRCVDAETCEEDAECLAGNYCDETINECKTNECDQQMTDCPRGTCDESVGECVNPTTCSSSDECLPDHSCVENRCVPVGQECGKNGCPGSQACDYNEQTLQAECEEAAGGVCDTSVDCTGNRACVEGVCEPPSACSADEFEPNDSTLTDFLEAAPGRTLDANLCGNGDVDRFSFDADEARGSTVRGSLIVDLAVDRSDIGLGRATLTLTNQSGDILASQSTGGNGRVHLERRLIAGQFDTFQLKVSGSNVNPSGIDYSLFAGIASDDVVSACSAAERITFPENRSSVTLSGNTLNGASSGISAPCVEGSDQFSEQVYTFRLEERRYVTIQANPAQTVDLALSLREQCASIGTEVACLDYHPAGAVETTARQLDPGTYSVVVQSAAPESGGSYNLSITKQQIRCTAAYNECVDQYQANVCQNNGTFAGTTFCPSTCNESTGRCARSQADACYNVRELGESASEIELSWDDYNDVFGPSGQPCFSGGVPTDGPDAVFEVTVPAGETLEATFTPNETGSEGALYLHSNCEDPGATCVASAASSSSTEQILYNNDSMVDETFFLVADTGSSDVTGTGTLSVKTSEPICEPGQQSCSDGNVRTCTESGLGYETTSCEYGCDAGQCQPPPFDTCGGAIDLTGGGTATGDWGDLDDDYNVSDSCAGDDTPGADGVYKVDLESDQYLDLSVSPSNSDGDPALYVTSSCSSAGAIENTCLGGVDDGFGGDSESLTVVPPGTWSGTRTFYIFVDGDEASGSSSTVGEYTLDVQVKQEICAPGSTSCKGGSTPTLEYCGSQGLNLNEFICQGENPSCISGSGSEPAKCSNPIGEICVDAVDLDKNSTVTTSVGTSDNLDLPAGAGSCRLNESADGNDKFFRIDLAANDLLRVNLTSQESDAQMYFMEDCLLPETCQRGTPDGSSNQTLQYFAEQQETVYLVVDSSDAGSFDGSDFTLDLDTTPNSTCVPNAFECTGPSQVSVCNATGTAFRSQFTCNQSCVDGTCQAPTGSPLPQDRCDANAPDIGGGTAISGTWANVNDQVENPGSACGINTGSDGLDVVYQLTGAAPGEVLSANLTLLPPGNNDDASLYVLNDCMNPDSSCVAGAASGSESVSLTHPVQSSGTLYLVAENLDTSPEANGYRLEVSTILPSCSPGSRSCTSNNAGISYCSANGIQQTYPCADECQNGSCVNPSGDRCVDAIQLTNGDSYSGNIGELSNSIEASPAPSCGTYAGTSSGPDAIFEVTGYSQGETIVADIESAPDSAVVYARENCSFTGDVNRIEQCSAGQTGRGTFRYYKQQPGPVYLVVDTISNSATGPVSLSLSKETGDVCQPGGASCTSTAAGETCNTYGDGTTNTYTCTGACTVNGICESPNSPNDTCSNAYPVDGGTRLIDDFARFNGDLAPDCVEDDSGEDAVYSLSVPANEAVQVQVQPLGDNADISTYFLDSCPPGGSGACLASGNQPNGAGEASPLFTGYHNTSNQAETVYFVVDHDGNPVREYLLDVEVGPTECTPGSNEKTCLNNSRQGECTSYGFFEPGEACYFGCPSGSNGCTTPPNDTCGGAISIEGDTSYYSNIGSYNNDYDANDRTSDAPVCMAVPSNQNSDDPQGENTPGPDAVYKVSLNEGDRFNATWFSPGNSVLWVTTDCTSSQEAASNCLKGTNTGGGSEQVQFTAPADDTYYVIADTNTDSGDSNPSGEAELRVDQAGDTFCDPASKKCKDGSSDTIQYCKKAGDRYIEQTCAGSCSSGSCTQQTGDYCEDHVDVPSVQVCNPSDSPPVETELLNFSYDATDYSNNYDLSFGCGGGGASDGNDRVFKVEIGRNEKLTVNANSSDPADDLQIQLTSACSVSSTLMGYSCVTAVDDNGDAIVSSDTGVSSDAGSDAGTVTNSETLTFNPKNSIEQTYFVVIDGEDQSSTKGTISGTIETTKTTSPCQTSSP